METNRSAESPGLSLGVRILLIVAGLGILFVAVAVVELATGNRTAREGAELLVSPRPIIPATVQGFPVEVDAAAATTLTDAYRRASLSVTDVEAATVGAGSTPGRLSAATVDPSANPASQYFRGEVLIGAAAGYGVEPAQFSYRIRDGVAVYTLVVSEGRLWVWFFSDAFVQLFVPAGIGDQADEMFGAVLDAMVDASRKAA